MAEWVRALDWRPDGRGFESHCGNLFASELWQFRLPRFANWCLSEETLKAVGPFYLVSMPGEPTSPYWNVFTTVVDSIAHSTLNSPISAYMQRKTLPCTEKEDMHFLGITKNEYGFRTEHSTEFAALELADRVITSMDHNETPKNIYLDLSKAFDTLDQSRATCGPTTSVRPAGFNRKWEQMCICN